MEERENSNYVRVLSWTSPKTIPSARLVTETQYRSYFLHYNLKVRFLADASLSLSLSLSGSLFLRFILLLSSIKSALGLFLSASSEVSFVNKLAFFLWVCFHFSFCWESCRTFFFFFFPAFCFWVRGD